MGQFQNQGGTTPSGQTEIMSELRSCVKVEVAVLGYRP